MQPNTSSRSEGSAKLVVIAPATPEALAALAVRLDAHLKTHPGLVLDDLLHRLPAGAPAPSDGRVVVAEHAEDLLDRLNEMADEPTRRSAVERREPRVAFVFSGQGSQWPTMGCQLLEQEPPFREALLACDQAIRQHSGWSVLDELRLPAGENRFDRVDIIQPVLFSVQVALANLWRSWGVTPAAVIGHSMGEVAAAHVGGALSLSDAAAIVCVRSALLKRIAGQGGMAFCALPMGEIERAILPFRSSLSVAASNGPEATVVSGSPNALRELTSSLQRRDVFCQDVNVDVAGHSVQVEPLLNELQERVSSLSAGPSQARIYSTVTAGPIEGSELDAPYWVQNLRQTVRFWQAFGALLDGAPTFTVEVSPHPILLANVEDIAERAGCTMPIVPSLRRGLPERLAMLSGLAALLDRGHPVGQNPLFALDAAQLGGSAAT